MKLVYNCGSEIKQRELFLMLHARYMEMYHWLIQPESSKPTVSDRIDVRRHYIA